MIHSLPATIVQNVRIGPYAVLQTLRVPARLEFRAGQFTHVRVDPERFSPLLRRPFSVWDSRPAAEGTDVDILFAIRGHGTQLLASRPVGARVGFLGPLGNCFEDDPSARHLLFIAGGVGIVPFYLFTRQVRARRPNVPITLLFGARTRDMLFGIERFAELAIDVRAATDDGSLGHKGFVTDLVRDFFTRRDKAGVQMFGCGPDPMLHALAKLARREGIPCQLSLETRMGCALGACRACVTPVVADGGWRYSRVCCEGPNYDARSLYWQ